MTAVDTQPPTILETLYGDGLGDVRAAHTGDFPEVDELGGLTPAEKFDDTDTDLLLRIDPADPLGVNHLLAARQEWDAELDETRRHWDDMTSTDTPTDEDEDGPPAVTAGEEDHANPWFFAAEEADPPADTGRPPDEPPVEQSDDEPDEPAES